RSTLREWLAPRRPSRRRPKTSFDQAEVPTSAYAYLLGFYLGDGTISLGRRDVYRLRIRTDSRYPGIIEECVWAMGRVMPMNRVRVQKLPYNAVEIGCSSKLWPLVFPQHG